MENMKYISISAMGKDRPGIVARFSKVLFDAGCNLEESSMLLIRSEFAMVLIVALPAKFPEQKFRDSIDRISKELDLTTSIRILSKDEAKTQKVKSELLYVLSVYGADKPGIVYNITQKLAELQINITDLSTRILSGGETPVYLMLLEIELVDEQQLEFLPVELDKLKKILKVDITLNQAESTDF